jgi:hypothetical protein
VSSGLIGLPVIGSGGSRGWYKEFLQIFEKEYENYIAVEAPRGEFGIHSILDKSEIYPARFGSAAWKPREKRDAGMITPASAHT